MHSSGFLFLVGRSLLMLTNEPFPKKLHAPRQTDPFASISDQSPLQWLTALLAASSQLGRTQFAIFAAGSNLVSFLLLIRVLIDIENKGRAYAPHTRFPRMVCCMKLRHPRAVWLMERWCFAPPVMVWSGTSTKAITALEADDDLDVPNASSFSDWCLARSRLGVRWYERPVKRFSVRDAGLAMYEMEVVLETR